MSSGWARCGADEIETTGIRLPRPVSPHLAARLHGTTIALAPLVESMVGLNPMPRRDLPRRTRWIVEGAGGVLVPINETETMADLIECAGLAGPCRGPDRARHDQSHAAHAGSLAPAGPPGGGRRDGRRSECGEPRARSSGTETSRFSERCLTSALSMRRSWRPGRQPSSIAIVVFSNGFNERRAA